MTWFGWLHPYLLDRLVERPPGPDDEASTAPGESIPMAVDYRAPLDDEFFYSKRDVTGRSDKSRRLRKRDLKDITAVVTHQTSVQRSAGVFDRRAHLITCHIAIGPTGLWYLVHPLDAYLPAADLANRFSVSIEFSGNFEGHPCRGDFYKPSKFGRSTLTDMQRLRGRQVLRWLQSQLPSINSCFAHRQFRTGKKAPKTLDPGWEIYGQINTWAKDELGWALRPDWTLGNGSPIPSSWREQTPE